MTVRLAPDSCLSMFSQLLMPAYLPFAFSFILMVGIGLVEAIGLGLGNIDSEVEVDAEVGFLSWLGLGGELPILIWLTSLLGCFTIAGVALQQIATVLSGSPLSPALAAGGAIIAGVPLNTLSANILARVMPGFETTVISTDDLLRQRGTILEGVARRGFPARAKVVDHHGQAHFVMVEPHEDGEEIPSGETALLVRREGTVFFVVPDRTIDLRPI